MLARLLNQGSGYLNAGAVPGRMGNRHPSIAPYETFATRDGDIASRSATTRSSRGSATCSERPALAADERFATNAARIEHRDELAEEIERALAGDDAAAGPSA